MADQEVVGKVGQMTGTAAPNQVGEVTVAVRGGSEAFFAYPVNSEATIRRGTRVLVLEYLPPRSVVVQPLP
ncbi:MAG: hypothetical protein JO247_17105 [Chloroflexi bacterium]|nr:hypothetical protein [Chloroflexota bacterium]